MCVCGGGGGGGQGVMLFIATCMCFPLENGNKSPGKYVITSSSTSTDLYKFTSFI